MRGSEVSGHYEQTNGTTVFYSFPCDAETALQKGMITICALAEIGQRSISDSQNVNDTILNAIRKVLKMQMVG